MQKFDEIVVSDLHLGARNSRGSDFVGFLKQVSTRHLIIAGDLFDSPRLRRLREGDVAVLKALRDLTERCRVTWIRGNHDPEDGWAQAVLGLDVCDEAILHSAQGRYLVTHGDRWDHSMEMPGLVVDAADMIYRGAQLIDRSHGLARMLKRRSKHFCRVIELLKRRARIEARRRGMTGIVLGHTHVAEDERRRGVHYLNSGCWTERPATFVALRAGVAATYIWDEQLRRLNDAEQQVDAVPATALAMS
ncbi:3-diacylglucosamine diphosphatase [Durusdinium trenchii]|uniref:3-diacylglucosamine diphosphatase n=1 Tax=Durusdinium trenchii TaxID=1381693 RepID=A0ABP0SI06_9DINO